MSHDARSVANYLILKTFEDKRWFTPIQVLKITYYCQGWHLASNRGAIFGQDIEAWTYGPVVADIYHALKQYVSDPITDAIPGYKPDFTSTERQFLSQIYDFYGKYGGIQLMRMTHAKGSPWDQIWNSPTRNSDHEVIPNGLIKEYFQQKRGVTHASQRGT